jgi:hypothetical protein
MKKLLISLCLLTGCLHPATAQNLVFHAGGGWTSLNGSSTKNIGAFKIGTSIEFELTQTLTIEPGLLYFAKGWKLHDQTVTLLDDDGNVVLDDSGNPRLTKMGTTNKTNYIVLPILFHYYIPLTLPHYIYLSAGPYIAYGISGKTRISGDTSQLGAARHYYDLNTFEQSGMHRFDTGISVGAGYEFNRLIYAGIEGDFGLTNVTGSKKNCSLLLTLGYRIHL